MVAIRLGLTAGALTAGALVMFVACDETAPGPTDAPADEPRAASTADWPPGTVMVVDDFPISEADVEQVVEWVRIVQPRLADGHWQRVAIANHILPRVTIGLSSPEARLQALERCLAARETLSSAGEAGLPPDLKPRRAEGRWSSLRLETWGTARGLEPGEWSDPLELPGSFQLVRLDERHGWERSPAGEALTVSILEFPFLSEAPTGASVLSALGNHQLTIVNEGWEDLVPESLKYQMRRRPR